MSQQRRRRTPRPYRLNSLRTLPAAAPHAVANDVPDNLVRPVLQSAQTRSVVVVQPSDVADWLRAHGGQARTTMRKLASDLFGRSPSGVHDAVRRAVAAGLLTSVSGPRGTDSR